MVEQKPERQKVTLIKGVKPELVDKLFKEPIPDEFWVVINPRGQAHNHSYGGITPFFKGLTEGKLLGTQCADIECEETGIWLPPRVDCPDCWSKMEWKEVDTSEARVYTHSTTKYPGAGFELENESGGGVPLISLEIPGVCTKLMSYLCEFGEGELHIGMRVKPIFRTENPTFSILDLSWVPVNDVENVAP